MSYTGDTERLRQLDLDQGAELLERGRDLFQQSAADVDRALEYSTLQSTRCTPIYRIPDDVLKLIFEEVHQPCPPNLVLSYGEPQCSPITISHVSRRWRNIALSLPTLWTCLHVEQRLELLELRVQRSGNAPLYIVERATETSLSLEEQIALLVGHALRWKAIFTLRMDGIVSSRLFKDPQDPGYAELPLLKFANIYNWKGSVCLDPFVPCPNLLRLSSAGFTTSFVGLNLFNLRHLNMTGARVTSKYLGELSVAAPQLVELTLSTFIEISSSDLGHKSTFLALKTLHFRTLPDRIHHHIRSLIEAPSLKTLVYNFTALTPHVLEDIRTHPSVTHLCLTTCYITIHPDHDADILRPIPSLRSLELINCSNVGLLLDHLGKLSHNDDNSGHLIPKLETLVVGRAEPEDHDALLHVVQRRSQLGMPLRELRLGGKLAEALDPELRQTLSKLVTVFEIER